MAEFLEAARVDQVPSGTSKVTSKATAIFDTTDEPLEFDGPIAQDREIDQRRA